MDHFNSLKNYCEEIGCICLENEPMKLHTSFKIGGPARLLLRPQNGETAAKVLGKARELSLPVMVLGKGSDLLVNDKGLDCAVVAVDATCAKVELVDETTIRCSAGTPLSQLCAFACQHGLTGLEFAFGIPGCVGGAVYMNAGAYGGEMKDVLKETVHITPEGTFETADVSQLELSYRHSFYASYPGYCITEAVFSLKKGEKEQIRRKMDELMDARKSKQPLEYPSAGSTFKRPPGAFAAALIDQCALKGKRIGGAMVSEKHAGFVINYDNATCEDVLKLIEFIKKEVKEKTGYELECEVKIL